MNVPLLVANNDWSPNGIVYFYPSISIFNILRGTSNSKHRSQNLNKACLNLPVHTVNSLICGYCIYIPDIVYQVPGTEKKLLIDRIDYITITRLETCNVIVNRHTGT